MKKTKMVIIILMLAFVSGCATSGRFSAIDLDLRTPEQTETFYGEAKVPYELDGTVETTSQPSEVRGESKSVSPWSFLAPIVKVFKGRFRVFSLEWKESK